MNVLLSWSGERSKAVATALYAWLPTVVPDIDPWMSSKDISKGREWFSELQGVLKEARNCLICVTPENVRSPWIYYETGAIAAKGPDVLIYPYLVGVAQNMLADGPLAKWQGTAANHDDTWELVKSLNENALESKHDLGLLEGNFRSRWQALGHKLESISQIEIPESEEFIATAVDQLAGSNLPSEARTMLVEVSKDRHGVLMYSRAGNGTTFQADRQNLCPDQSPRTVARWKAALDTLIACDLLESRGDRGSLFALTAKGFELADVLGDET